MASDEEEFTAIFNETYPNLCRFLESLLGNHGAAQDIAQESFMRLFRKGTDGIPADEARFWLFRVARNLALNEIRNKKRRGGFFDKILEALYPHRPNQAETFEQDESTRLAIEKLQTLPEHQRAVLLLREQEEMSYQEIAEVLNISEGKVKVDIFRGRNALHKEETFKQKLSSSL
jgi:RNA polymerase sigma-70 factor (ECF subfamily)